MECYPSLKRKETLTYAITWMYLLDIMLSETKQPRKNTVPFHLYDVLEEPNS